MKPCILIKGTDKSIDDFENQIAFALEQGYEISGDLISHVVKAKDLEHIVLLQPMFLSDENFSENENF
mgnify:CR=1 FL=1